MKDLTRHQEALGNEDFVLLTQESWESILSLPFGQRFEVMDAYIACSSFLFTTEVDGYGEFDDNKLWHFLKDHTAGHILVGMFVPAELESLEPLLKSMFEMIGWSDGGIFYKRNMETPITINGCRPGIVFNTWAKFHEFVFNCYIDDNPDSNEVMDCKFICEKIRHFLALNPDLPQIEQQAVDKAA